MAIFEWSDDYAVGIAAIDEQHRRLVEMINDLHRAMLAHQGQLALCGIAGRMLAYAEEHFAAEEGLLARHGYPRLGAHRAEHALFAAKAREIADRLGQRHFVLSLEVIRFLRDWLAEHILGSDKRYVPFLAEQDVR